MAGIYFIIPKTSDKGYIGLDSGMTASSFPRLVDHVAAAYGVYGRDIYRGSYQLAAAGDVRKSVQSCEQYMREQCCCNFDYKVVLKSQNCYGLGEENYKKFCETWNSTYKEPEMSWAEVYYIYKYSDKHAALNEVWGGAGRFVFNINSIPDKMIGDMHLRKLVADAQIIWFPDRNKKKDLEHMRDLFFPYAKAFNVVMTYYINNFIMPDISKALFEAIGTKEAWNNNGNNVDLNIAKTIDQHTQLKDIVEAFRPIMQKNYNLPDTGVITNNIVDTISNVVKTVVNSVRDAIEKAYTKTGSFNKQKAKVTFNLTLPVQKLSSVTTTADFPNWWPETDAFSTATDVTEHMRSLVSTTIFPAIVSNAQKRSFSTGINVEMVQSYLEGVGSGLMQQANFRIGFYYPCRNVWLDNYNGPIDEIKYVGFDMILIHRSMWLPDVYEKMKRNAFETSRNIRDITLW